MKIVIRAGGMGTRLWPISRQKNPKQFQALVDDKSLIRNTVNRVKPLVKDKNDLFISVNREVVKKLKKEIPELPGRNLISEPAGKNTGPAVCLESFVLKERFGEDVVVASLPSDDYISDAVAFRKMLKTAEKFLEKNPDYIITPGARPVYPDTGYSYIKTGSRIAGGKEDKIFKVAEWIEKPDLAKCKKIVQSGKYFCHMGMYVWKIRTVLDLFKKFQPKIYEACKKAATGQDKTAYVKLEKITVESAITKKTKKIAVIVSERVGWSDLGKWHILAKIISQDKFGNITRGKNVALDTKNCLIYGPKNKLVATVGLENMVVVLTEDALLVCPKEESGDVKKIVEELEKRNLKKFI